MSKTPWSDDEYEFLMAHADWTAMQLGARLGRSKSSVRGAQQRIRDAGGVPTRASRKGSEADWWSDEEYGFLVDNPSLTAREVGLILGRSQQSVQHARYKLRDGWTPERVAWSAEEVEYVRSTPHMTAVAVAGELGKTVYAVQNRRNVLAKTEGLVFDLWGGNKSPYWVGARRLLARTCPKCGHILDSSWYGKQGSRRQRDHWNVVCFRCRGEYGGGHKRPQGLNTSTSARASEARYQAITAERATKNRQPWTAQDHKILADPDLLVVEKALKLGRTYMSVRGACTKFGYASKVGRGDPAKGAWHIQNPNAVA